MKKTKRIGLVAHDNRKADLIEWVTYNSELLSKHKLTCTGTTGRLVEKALQEKGDPLSYNIEKLNSGPMGGDSEMGAMIAEGKLDILIFFTDPMSVQPHDVDVKALTRLASLYNIALACNRATADMIISSPLFDSDYIPKEYNYDSYIERLEDKQFSLNRE